MRNDVVREGRLRGRRRRVGAGRSSAFGFASAGATTAGTPGAAGTAAAAGDTFLSAESGWPTLQLSREMARFLRPSRHPSRYRASISATVASSGMLTVLDDEPERNGCTAASIFTWPM